MEGKKSRLAAQEQASKILSKGEQMTTPATCSPRGILAEVSIEILGVGNDSTITGYITGAKGKAASQYKIGTIKSFAAGYVTVDVEEVTRRRG
jgi:hypothetical protein